MSAPVKVLMLVENSDYPEDTRVRREAETLQQAGYQVAVIAPRLKISPYHEIINGVSVYRFSILLEGNNLLGFISEFAYATLAMLFVSFRVWWSHGFDIIHAANPPDTFFIIGGFYKFFGKKFIFDQHDLAPETYLSRFAHARPNLIYRGLRFFEWCSYRTANRVIVTNESYRKMAVTRGKKQPDHVFIVRNGPVISVKSQPADKELAKRAPYIICYIGVIAPQDGVDYWLHAIYELVYTLNRRDFLAVIIGDGDSLPELKQLAKELNIEPYVWFSGWVSDEDELLRYISTAHICVHPDPLNPLNQWSTTMKMMDYMAAGKPVVSFDLLEARYSAQSAALYAQPNDVLDFARKVAWLMDHKDERDRMGEFGRKRFCEALAWDYSIEKLLETYQSVIDHDRKPDHI